MARTQGRTGCGACPLGAVWGWGSLWGLCRPSPLRPQPLKSGPLRSTAGGGSPPPPLLRGGNVTLTFLLETVGCTFLSKRAGNRDSQPTLSSNPQPMPELPTSSSSFGVVKRSFTQCLWKRHTHRRNIMFQCDSHHRCCACTAAVLKCCSWVVQSPPFQGVGGEPSLRDRHDIGGGITRGGGKVQVADDLNAEGSGQQDGNEVRQVADDQDNTQRGGTIGPHGYEKAARPVVDDLNAEGSGQQKP